mgnify:CR=1 FL=1|jgi:hypothetical protein
MKRALAIALLLLASGGMGRAVILCARSLCAMPLAQCCCHRPGESESARLMRPMGCETSSGMPAHFWRNVEARPCCVFSAASARTPGEVISTSAASPLHERGTEPSPEIVPPEASPPVRGRAFSDDLVMIPPIYLRFAVLRI